MLGRADEALYKAKHEGRNKVITLSMPVEPMPPEIPASAVH
jgi:hypothetical protein